MPPKEKPDEKADKFTEMLYTGKIPFMHKREMLRSLLADPTPLAEKVLQRILTDAAANTAQETYQKKAKELDELINEMRTGPLRVGTFVESNGFGGGFSHFSLASKSLLFSSFRMTLSTIEWSVSRRLKGKFSYLFSTVRTLPISLEHLPRSKISPWGAIVKLVKHT